MIDLDRTTVLLELWRTSRRARVILDEALADTELTSAEYGLYSLLRWEAPMTVTEVARRAGTPTTTASQALRRLEARGHLTREANPDDARSSVVALSDAGAAVHAEASDAFGPVIRAVHGALGADQQQVAYSLVQLDHVLREFAGEPVDGSERLDPRGGETSSHHLTYAGTPLTAREETEARAFVDWLRHRRGAEV